MDNTQKIISLCKRRGFVFPSSEIYGGLANVYDYGPLGVELLNNIRKLWWSEFVHKSINTVGIESQIFMHPNVWKASGHVDGFSDPLVEDKVLHTRYRADHLIEDWLTKNGKEKIDLDSFTLDQFNEFISKNSIKSPDGNDLTEVKNFNLMFETQLGSVEGEKSKLYLRAETAQGMYVLFKNILDSTRLKVPFGVAQYGKAFRNEITKGKFIFRTLEFEQMEIQYFIKDKNWHEEFENWRKKQENWYFNILKIDKSVLRWKPHTKLVFYAKAAEDMQFKFDWGFDEVGGLHYRTDYDLSTHAKHSGQDLNYLDPKTGEKYIPHVIESTFGLNRTLLMLLSNAYFEEADRIVLRLDPKIAPYKVAVFPLVKNKPEVVQKAREIYESLVNAGLVVAWDDRGNVGKRYYSQDEIGTPKCVTIDYQTLEDGTVTIRDRDTMKQIRVKVEDIKENI